MKIAIMGAGVAGSYLARILNRQGHSIEVFEMSKKENHWGVCAWGASKIVLSQFSRQADLDFDNYIFRVGQKVSITHVDKTIEVQEMPSLVTFDKHKWECDLLEGIRVRYGVRYTSKTFPSNKYDYVIDCTGIHRDLLPPSKEDFTIPSLEYLVDNIHDIDGFHIRNYRNANGYFWHFPLSEGRAYIGALDIEKRYEGIKEFFENHPEARILKRIGRPLRLSPPKRMKPFCFENIIGVGESIGCVFPITGEGIGPSLRCCDVFLDVVKAGNDDGVVENKRNRDVFDIDMYEKKILDTFDYYDDAYKILRAIIKSSELAHTLYALDLKKLVPNDPRASSEIKKIALAIQVLSMLQTK